MPKKNETSEKKKAKANVLFIRNLDQDTTNRIRTLASINGVNQSDVVENLYKFALDMRKINNPKIKKALKKYGLEERTI